MFKPHISQGWISTKRFFDKYQRGFLGKRCLTTQEIQIIAHDDPKNPIHQLNSLLKNTQIYDLEWQIYDPILATYHAKQDEILISSRQIDARTQEPPSNILQLTIPLFELKYYEEGLREETHNTPSPNLNLNPSHIFNSATPLKLSETSEPSFAVEKILNWRDQIKNDLSGSEQTIIFISPNAIYGFDYFLKKYQFNFNDFIAPSAKLFCMGDTSKQLIQQFWQRQARTSPKNHAQSLFQLFNDDLNTLQKSNILIIQGNYQNRKTATDQLIAEINAYPKRLKSSKVISFKTYQSDLKLWEIGEMHAQLNQILLANKRLLSGLEVEGVSDVPIIFFSLLKSSAIAKEISKQIKYGELPHLQKCLEKKELFFYANYAKIFQSLSIDLMTNNTF
jgi:hypothetical protein